MHNPCLSHQHVILRICCYLQVTADKGLSFKPTQQLTLDCYVDADYAGLYNVEHQNDPVCVKSHTGFVLTLGSWPLLWSSKLQTEITLSTTEVEYIALFQLMFMLLPMWSLLKEVGANLQLSFLKDSVVKTCVWEDNNGTLQLATNPNKVSIQTKHLAVKYHFFQHHIESIGKIWVLKVNTTEQIADIFTKGLLSDTFTYLVGKLMGWHHNNLQ